MQPQRYALVSYVSSSVGRFVERLRQELHPELPHLPAHLTILPPRTLRGSELFALQTLEEVCSQAEPFDVELGEVETFVPVTDTVFIDVARGGQFMHGLHERLNIHALQCAEEWPYMPHLTVARLNTREQAERAYLTARDRWAEFSGSRVVSLKQLTFVREESENHWVDLAGLPLGRSLVER
jgi:2'-5' RNA ligase